jgi:hypothetical protein
MVETATRAGARGAASIPANKHPLVEMARELADLHSKGDWRRVSWQPAQRDGLVGRN